LYFIVTSTHTLYIKVGVWVNIKVGVGIKNECTPQLLYPPCECVSNGVHLIMYDNVLKTPLFLIFGVNLHFSKCLLNVSLFHDALELS
jgi:hypothetical protein